MPETYKSEMIAKITNPDKTTVVSSTNTATRSTKFWFYDGSIILHVQNTLFRIHKTILGNHSELFSDMFSLPQPPGQVTLEGCHLLTWNDGVDDVIDLLKALYYPTYFDNLSPTATLSTTLVFISGILRLSTKYLMSSLRQRCITILQSKLPTAFEQFNAMADARKPMRHSSISIMRAINLAKETNVPTVLPFAFYCVAQMKLDRILDDLPEHISWQDKTTCMVGRDRLAKASLCITHSFLFLFTPSSECTTHLCQHAREPHVEFMRIETEEAPHPLKRFDRWKELRVCDWCVSHAYKQHEVGRRDVWERLPSLFGLPVWEKLRERQME